MDINLLPKTTRSRRLYNSQPILWTRFIVVLPVVVVIVAAGVVAGWVQFQTNRLQAQVTVLNQQVQGRTVNVDNQARPTQAQQLEQALTAQSADRTDWTSIVGQVNGALPVGLTVDMLSASGGVLTVAGRSAGVNSVAQFEQTLTTEPWAASVTLQSVMQATGQKTAIFSLGKQALMSYTYSLTVTLKSVNGGGSTT